ncbi:hypothetical protein ABEW34_01845 [Paenibacillus algorifonticola]|uniref:hypothetical protein n=1 Tax=Paenibacillus algorifonticola TaxID=684063 RepID=UPI003D2C48B2
MFCVIQKVTNKKPVPYGAHKELIAESRRSNLWGTNRTKYSYRYGQERFERPNLDAYKISIHHSYREAGKVRKQQWVICTMSYYSLLTTWPGDCITRTALESKLAEMKISAAELWDMIDEKLNPIIDQVRKEFEQTEEYRVSQEHERILKEYRESKRAFEELYGPDTYDFCYDVFGKLQKPKSLERIKEAQREREEDERRYQKRRSSNYDYSDFFKNGSYSAAASSNYNDEEKAKLKKLFRHLSKNFHPDITKDDGEMMKLINKLKDGWGI